MDIKGLSEFEGCPDPVWYYAKGEHAREVFAAALSEKLGYTIRPAEVQTGYVRWVPAGPLYGDGRMVVMRFDAKPGRGAFVVTYVDLADC